MNADAIPSIHADAIRPPSSRRMQDMVVPMTYLLSLNASFNKGYLRAVFAEAARVAPGIPIYYHAWCEHLAVVMVMPCCRPNTAKRTGRHCLPV